MTLEQAIEHAEEVAAEQSAKAKTIESNPWGEKNKVRSKIQDCLNCAAEHRQLAAWLRELQRARVLLKATHDLLEAADDSPYVEDVLAILVHYDDTDCDGSCLMEDIEYYFEEFGEERKTNG